MVKRKDSLAAQFVRFLAVSLLGCVLLFGLLQAVYAHALRNYFDVSGLEQAMTRHLSRSLQTYVREHKVSSRDKPQITRWVQKHDSTMLMLYRNKKLVYGSFDPGFDPAKEPEKDLHLPDWMSSYPIRFQDGEADAFLVCDTWQILRRAGTAVFLVLCLGLFFGLFVWRCRLVVRYISQLSEEIQAMEGGDLEHPITVKGKDELTTLASCLDSMRLTLHSQQQAEAEAAAKVKNLITEMSHDLRTPLTTLLLYTEILRQHKYDTKAQAGDYLAKIDEKAHQIKQMSDNLFEYALVTRDTVAVLDEPARFSQIFEEPLTELVCQLQQRGFACALELGEEDPLVQVNGSYIRRILDNISSNLLKYADARQDIGIRVLREGSRIGLAFRNRILQDTASAESTKVGLTSIETMMQKMNAQSRIEQSADAFCITLWFPVLPDGTGAEPNG